MASTRFETRTYFDLEPNLNDDLNDELLYCVLLMSIVVIPTALCVLSLHYPLFTYAEKFSPNFFDWLTFLGVELVRDVPFMEDLRTLAHAQDISKFTPTPLGEKFVFFVRVIVDVSVLAILFQSFSRSSSDALQKEQFQDPRSPVDRVDPIEERELFQKAEKDWKIVLNMPHYNNHRLEAVVSRVNSTILPSHLSEIVGAARVAGFQMNGAAIAKVLFLRGDRYREAESIRRVHDDFRERRSFNIYPPPKTDSPRATVAVAILEGLQRKVALLGEFAPHTRNVEKALTSVDGISSTPQTPKLSAEIEGISRAGQIEMLIQTLESGDWTRSYRAERELTTIVNPADAQIYRSMAGSDNYTVRNSGISLLSILPPDPLNEATLLAAYQAGNAFNALTGLSRIGSKATFEALKSTKYFAKAAHVSKYISGELCSCLVSIAMRETSVKAEIVDFFTTKTTALHNHITRGHAAKALGYLYETDHLKLLLECAWQGYSGEDERSAVQVCMEARQGRLFNVQISAVRALASAHDAKVLESLHRLFTKLKKDYDRDQITMFRRLVQRLFGVSGHRGRLMAAIEDTIISIQRVLSSSIAASE